jgi:hypothetical protein
MTTQFICLANSKKYSGRCLAGIEVRRDEAGKFHLVRDEAGGVRWVRPVSHAEHGEVPIKEVEHLELLDIVECDMAAPCPQGYQSENFFYEGKRFEKVGHLNARFENLDQLAEHQATALLGNQRKSISDAEADALGQSIVLVKAAAATFRLYEKRAQLRAVFEWAGKQYDLPVTDIVFHLRWIDEPDVLAGKQHIYLCVSLAISLEGQHYKLVAGVLGA